MSVSHHRGIRLGLWPLSCPGESRYRVRLGRSLALVTAAALDREWLDAYIRYHGERGEHGCARDLRQRWLAAEKVRA